MQVPSYSYKYQITNYNFANLNYKSQITKEGVNENLITNGNEGIKLDEANEEAKDTRKTQKKPTKLTSIKKKLGEQRKLTKKKPKKLWNMFQTKLGPESNRFVHQKKEIE